MTRWRAPGRINLIGEHTDYNDGFVLPLAISYGCVATVESAASQWRAVSAQQPEPVVVDPSGLPGSPPGPAWASYVLGAAWLLHDRGVEVPALSIAVDSIEYVDALRRWLPKGAPVRVVVDVDASLRIGPAHLGVRRSPIRSPRKAAAVAGAARDAGLQVVGMMFYDAQIAGLPDSSPVIRLVKSRSDASLRRRRAAVRAAIEDVTGPLQFANGGGTGSLEVTGADPALTELAAGSGLVGPTLFDGYDAFTPQPAVAFALPVVRRAAKDIVTCFSGGYIASGPAGRNRVPAVHHPQGLKMIGTEGAGEVQTPLRGKAARDLSIGDRVWFRHAKAGELAERFDEYVVISGDEVVDVVPTYRGEGKNFG